jgi:hypothetical protein
MRRREFLGVLGGTTLFAHRSAVTMLFVAVHESACGTFETSRDFGSSVAIREKWT